MINFEFISELEGGLALDGYVPDVNNSKSGVTIATGFDLGQCSVKQLKGMFPDFIANKLIPYAGVIREEALDRLSERPLHVSKVIALSIDKVVKRNATERLIAMYDRDSKHMFKWLCEPARTVIASVGFQYGSLPRRCPTFWRHAVNDDVELMYEELMDFGDKYPTRRKREAKYLIT